MHTCKTQRVRRRRRTQRDRALRAVLAAILALLVLLTAIVAFLLLRDRGLPGEGIEVPDDVAEAFLPVNRWSRPGVPLEEINGVVIHYVGNPNTSAMANRGYFSSLALTGETYASSHFIVGLEGEVIACVPLTEIAYASNTRNADTVSIEVCHADETGQYSPVTYERVVELTAWLCETFGLDPGEDVIRHYDVTGKRCPKYYVDHPEAWEGLKADVAAAMG